MDRLTILPDAQGYSFTNERQHRQSSLDAPINIYSRGVPTNMKTVICTWHLTQNEWLTFFKFFNEKWQRVETFIVALFVETGDLVDYKAKFIQNSFKLTDVSGDLVVVTINLEIDKL